MHALRYAAFRGKMVLLDCLLSLLVWAILLFSFNETNTPFLVLLAIYSISCNALAAFSLLKLVAHNARLPLDLLQHVRVMVFLVEWLLYGSLLYVRYSLQPAIQQQLFFIALFGPIVFILYATLAHLERRFGIVYQ